MSSFGSRRATQCSPGLLSDERQMASPRPLPSLYAVAGSMRSLEAGRHLVRVGGALLNALGVELRVAREALPLENSARTESPAVLTIRPWWKVMMPSMTARWAASTRIVPSSSWPICRLYPTASAARMHVSRRLTLDGSTIPPGSGRYRERTVRQQRMLGPRQRDVAYHTRSSADCSNLSMVAAHERPSAIVGRRGLGEEARPGE